MHEAASEIVNDDHLAFLDNVMVVGLIERVGLQSLLDTMEQVHIRRIVKIGNAEQAFSLRNTSLCQYGRVILFIDEVVTGRDLGLLIFVSFLEPRDHHDEQLQDDAGRDVGHDAEREDRQLQQRAAREEVDQPVEAAGLDLLEAGLDVGDVHSGRRDLRAEPEERDDPQDEQQLASQVRRPERVGESA